MRSLFLAVAAVALQTAVVSANSCANGVLSALAPLSTVSAARQFCSEHYQVQKRGTTPLPPSTTTPPPSTTTPVTISVPTITLPIIGTTTSVTTKETTWSEKHHSKWGHGEESWVTKSTLEKRQGTTTRPTPTTTTPAPSTTTTVAISLPTITLPIIGTTTPVTTKETTWSEKHQSKWDHGKESRVTKATLKKRGIVTLPSTTTPTSPSTTTTPPATTKVPTQDVWPKTKETKSYPFQTTKPAQLLSSLEKALPTAVSSLCSCILA